MPFIPTPAGVARIRYSWQLGDATAQNVFYVDTGLGASLTPAQCDQLIVIAEGALTHDSGDGHTLVGQLSDAIVCQKIHVEDASISDGAQSDETVAVQGLKGSPSVPPGVAVVTTWETGFRGRDKRGRTFWAGMPEGEVSNSGSLFDSTWLPDFTDAANNFRVAFEAGGAEFPDMVGLVVASFYHQVVEGTPPTVARAVAQITPITAALVRNYVKSQRRRNLAG